MNILNPSTTTALPASIFVSHGAPTLALETGAVGPAFEQLGKLLGDARGIVVVSPHWQTSIPTVGTAAKLKTIHDFTGFPEALYTIDYPANGSDSLAKQVIFALESAGAPVCTDPTQGLDHGAWVPLRTMFPQADKPVVPLSLLREGGPKAAYRLGQALQPLVRQGYVVMGTGSMTHNLDDYRTARQNAGQTPAYVPQFANWMAEKADACDLAALLAYREHAPSATRAHPTEEHLMPFFVALGAAGGKAKATRIHQGVQDYVLAMDAYTFGPAN